MSSHPPLLRPSDADAVRAELRAVSATLGVPLTFGGEVIDGTLVISELLGARTAGLRGLHVPAGFGLGGRVVAERRPGLIDDYATSRGITHQFDRPVLAEGIHSIAAVPVVVDGQARAVLYAAVRTHEPLGSRALDVVVQAGRRLTTELSIRDEVDRRLRLLTVAEAQNSRSAVSSEEIRSLYAELRRITAVAGGPGVQERLRELSERLGALGGAPSNSALSLSEREIDVLAQVALGCSNVECARRLGLKPETVKSYLRNAMRKLDAHTRYEAVVVARRAGLLP